MKTKKKLTKIHLLKLLKHLKHKLFVQEIYKVAKKVDLVLKVKVNMKKIKIMR